MSSGHSSNGRILNLRVQKALGSEFLIFADNGTKEVYIVDVQSIHGDPADPNSVNNEINANKIKVPVQVGNTIELTESNGNDGLLAIAWTEKRTPGAVYGLVLVAITKQGGSFQFVKCPNASRDLNVDEVPEIKIIIRNNEPKLVNISRTGANYVVDGFGH